jgi:CubicO group peptidase (beta-lactamase class C family)
MSKRALATAVAFLCLAAVAVADQAADIDALVGRYAALEQFNGSVLVADGGRVIFKKGYGMANFEWQIPNTPDTRFRLGSITKQFTSMLVMQLVEEGKLSLDAKLATVLPWYRQDTGSRVTIHELLNHTSGIPSYTSLPGFFREHGRETMPLKELVTKYCSNDLEFEPGTKFRYDNAGYVILGAVIEEITGERYEDVLQKKILEPTHMLATGYDHTETIIPKRAAGYARSFSGLRNAEFLDMSLPGAAGALYSTVEDLYRWDQALYGDSLLSAAGKETMFTPGLSDYAYGWAVKKMPIGPDKAERLVIRHNGGINGFGTAIVRVPAERVLVVLLDNCSGSSVDPIVAGILDVLYGRTPPAPKRSIAAVLWKALGEEGLDAALARYRTLKEREPDAYSFDEDELNTLGYALLAAGRTADAIGIFKLNVEAFPEASNPYDSLGEAYAAASQKELAIKSYARSLELDPGNANAVRQLAKLMQ